MGDNRNDFDATSTGASTTGHDAGSTGSSTAGSGAVAEVTQLAKDNASKISTQAADKARHFAEDGKARASGALDQLSQMLTDAAGQVDEKLGGQYGGYARQAASSVQGFSDSVKNKDVDQLIGDVRAFVRKSPAVAIGAAAAIGFVVARVVAAGLDSTEGAATTHDGSTRDQGNKA